MDPIDSSNEASRLIGSVVDELTVAFPEVSASSLRFLESRGLVTPDRSAGGQRVYAPEHVERIRTIKRWQRERLSLDEIAERLSRRTRDSELPSLVSRVVEHVEHGTVAGAAEVLNDLVHSGTSLIALFDRVLVPVLRALGNDWHDDPAQIDRQLEFDETVTHLVGRFGPASNPRPVGVVVAATPAWERHDFGLRMLLALLRERGVVVHYLGTCVESHVARRAVDRIRPHIVLTSLTVPPPPSAARRWIDEITGTTGHPGPAAIVGGRSAAHMRRHIDAPVSIDDDGLPAIVAGVLGLLADVVPPPPRRSSSGPRHPQGSSGRQSSGQSRRRAG